MTDRELPLTHSQTRNLVSRIARALEIPEAEFLSLLGVTASLQKASAADTESIDLDRQCERLLRAFRNIGDPEKRHRLLTLVLMAAERD